MEWLFIHCRGRIALKILQYLPGLPPVLGGGMIKYALDLVQGEKDAGHEVILLVPGHFTHSYINKTRIIRKKWQELENYSIVNPLTVTCGKGVSVPEELIVKGNTQVYMEFLNEVRPEMYTVLWGCIWPFWRLRIVWKFRLYIRHMIIMAFVLKRY